MTISLHYQKRTTLPARLKLKEFVKLIFNVEQQAAISLSIVFCDDAYLLSINQQFLQHDYYTDIITFNYADANAPVEGELFISIDMVGYNARSHGLTIREELHRVIFHGVLHLCGYGDKTAKEKHLMTNKEDHYLNQYKKFLLG